MEYADLTYELTGFTFLVQMRLTCELATGKCTLVIDLAREPSASAPSRRVVFEDVSNLSLFEFGGGWTQLLYLTIEDVRDRQLDRVRYLVVEREREMLSFACAAIQLSGDQQVLRGDSPADPS